MVGKSGSVIHVPYIDPRANIVDYRKINRNFAFPIILADIVDDTIDYFVFGIKHLRKHILIILPLFVNIFDPLIPVRIEIYRVDIQLRCQPKHI